MNHTQNHCSSSEDSYTGICATLNTFSSVNAIGLRDGFTEFDMYNIRKSHSSSFGCKVPSDVNNL